MATLKPPLARSSSSTRGKRRKLEGELRSAESGINRKQQQLQEAQEKFSRIGNAKLDWMDQKLTWVQILARCVTEGKEEKEKEEAKLQIKVAQESVEMLQIQEAGAARAVQLLEDELVVLQQQWSSTKRHLSELVPDASEYFHAVVGLGAPSDLVSHHAWWKAQRLDRNINPLFLCFVPPEAQPGMPVELAEKVFSQFLVDAKEDVVDQRDCAFTHELCNLVGQELENEREKAKNFRKMLTDYLGEDLDVRVVDISCHLTPSAFPTDGCVMFLNHMALLAEVKLDPETTLFQAMQYYAVHMADLKERGCQESFWPCFLIEFVGTCIRLSALAYFEKVACQPLTPFLHCYIDDFNRSDMNTLCRAMRALRTGVHKLRYMGSAAVTRNKNIPYHLCLPGWEFQKRIAGKLMFVMKGLESGELKVVKFCRQYGVSVHEAWAAQGLAPRLIHHSKGRDGWYAIEMKYLDPDEWKSVHEWSNTPQTSISIEQLQGAISNALTGAHQIRVNGSKTVHGDMRSPNIMVRKREEGGRASFEVKFVDFDWSGIDGQTYYPSFMNMDLKWHPDVGPGKPLHQEHDTHWLGALSVEHHLHEACVGDFEMNV